MCERLKLTVKQTEPSELAEKFTYLYCGLITNLYNIECPHFLTDVKDALKAMRRLKYDTWVDQKRKREVYIDIKYEESAVRCAYLYGYGVLNTAIVYHEFSKHLRNTEDVILRLSLRKTLKICCLAGGPGSEALAISKAVDDFIKDSCSESDLLTHVQVTVIDSIHEWETEGEALFNELNRSTYLFNSGKIHFHYKFVKADLLSPFEESVKTSIAEADIITVVKFASSLEEKSANICVSYLTNMIKNVTDCMRKNSCLFMLDVTGGNLFRNTIDVVSTRPNEYPLKISCHKKYRLLPKTLQKMQACINFRSIAETGTIFPTVLTAVFSCFWVKNPINFQQEHFKNANEDIDPFMPSVLLKYT